MIKWLKVEPTRLMRHLKKSISDVAEMPKDEDEKFKFGDIFTDNLNDDESIENVFDKFWPKMA